MNYSIEFKKSGFRAAFLFVSRRGSDIVKCPTPLNLGEKKYVRISLSSYDNPILNEDDIRQLEDEIAAIGTDQAVRQEIYGEFIESDAVNPFATNYDKEFHESESVVFDYTKQIYIIVDFNLNPFAVTFWHHFQDVSRYNWLGFDEASIDNGSLDAMAELIIMRYGPYLHSAILSGDSMGNNRNIALKDNASNYIYLQRKLGLASHQVRVPHNPTHEKSRTDTNNWMHPSSGCLFLRCGRLQDSRSSFFASFLQRCPGRFASRTLLLKRLSVVLDDYLFNVWHGRLSNS